MTSTLVAAPLIRLTVQPDAENGLRKPSKIMIDNATTIMRTKIGAPLADSTMKPWFQSIALWRCFSDLPEETARIICGW